MRHAATAGNLLRRYIGTTDEPLSPEGRAAAEAAAISSFVSCFLAIVSPFYVWRTLLYQKLSSPFVHCLGFC